MQNFKRNGRIAQPARNQAHEDLQTILAQDAMTLESFGSHLIFEPIDSESSRYFAEFIIKSNYLYGKDHVATVLINSPGGSVYDGFGIIDLMECSKVKIQTVAIGCVASMASLIFVCGTPGLRVMSRNAYIMTHQFSEYLEGKYHDLVAARTHEDELHARFVSFYKKHSTMTEQQINEILLKSSDTYINAEKALEYGLCDKIQDPWEEEK